MRLSLILLGFATAALGLPVADADADVGATKAGKQPSGNGGGAANQGTPTAGAPPSSSSSSSAAAPSATGGAISESVIPDYGITAGRPSTSQPGSCVGANGLNIPCACPPPKPAVAAALSTFVARGRAGSVPITFPPSDDGNTNTTSSSSLAANRARINAIVNTLQNFNFDTSGRTGDGCPAASFPALAAVQKKLQAGENVQVGGGGGGGASGSGSGSGSAAAARRRWRRALLSERRKKEKQGFYF